MQILIKGAALAPQIDYRVPEGVRVIYSLSQQAALKGGIMRMETQVYLASDIQKALGLGKTKTYEFLNQVYKEKEPPFRVIKVGTAVRVTKQSFDHWLNAMQN